MKKIFWCCLVIFITQIAFAVPQFINYQGYLTRTDGSPLDTTVAMTFTIYDASIGGSAVWTETRASVLVSDGLFNASLGSVTPLPDVFSANRYLGIRIGTDTEMIPRQAITSVAHAYRVGTVDGASGGTITGDVNIVGKGNIGSGNSNSGTYAFVAGRNNTASGNYSTVGGGYHNTASSYCAAVGGGYDNTASDWYGTVGGGYNNDVSGPYSTVPGGLGNTCSGDYSFVCGSETNVTADSAFVFSDGSGGGTLGIGANRTFSVKASGGVRFWTNSTLTAGVTLAAGGSAWAAVSDSTLKRNIRLVDTKEVLDKVSQLPIKQWSYKSQDPSIEHIGPMAQDFYAAFHLGESDTTINTLDPDGIALAAIQGLYKEVVELRARVQTLEAGQQKATKEEK